MSEDTAVSEIERILRSVAFRELALIVEATARVVGAQCFAEEELSRFVIHPTLQTRTNPKKRIPKPCPIEIRNQLIRRRVYVLDIFIVSYGFPSAFPDMFLRILLRRISRKVNDFNVPIFLDPVLRDTSLMPPRVVPEEDNFLFRVDCSDFLKDISRYVHGLIFRLERVFFSRFQVEKSIDAPPFSSSGRTNNFWKFSFGKPGFLNSGFRGKHHFIFGEDNGVFFFQKLFQFWFGFNFPCLHFFFAVFIVDSSRFVIGELCLPKNEVQACF